MIEHANFLAGSIDDAMPIPESGFGGVEGIVASDHRLFGILNDEWISWKIRKV